MKCPPLRATLYVALACCEVGLFLEAAILGTVFVGPSGYALLIVAGLLFPGWCRTPRGRWDVSPDPARRLPTSVTERPR